MKDRQYNCQKKKRTKGQTMIYKTLHRKLNIQQHEPYWKPGVSSGASEGYAVPAAHVKSVVLQFISECFNNEV